MKDKKIVLVSGHIESGKSSLAKSLEQRFEFFNLKTGAYLREHIKLSDRAIDLDSLRTLARHLDEGTHGKWILDAILKAIHSNGGHYHIVVDAVRRLDQIRHVRERFGLRVIHVHLVKSGPIENDAQTDNDTTDLCKDSDLCIDTKLADDRDIFVRVASRLQLYAPPSLKCVDVVVGGQYGSEGKGQIAAYLAKNYDVLMRVGGPNAGHKVRSESGEYTYHHLPSGCRDTKAEILIGPGAVVNPDNLLTEISDCRLDPGRVFVDPQAMTIAQSDIEQEQTLVQSIGSTGQGVGSATARKIMDRNSESTLARSHEKLSSYLGRSYERLERAYAKKFSILLEGTQGSGLSLHHGHYPNVTSRDTNVAGCLAEAGISPAQVRRTIMVVRSYPIRVANPPTGGTSGFLKKEISFEIIAKRSGLDANELVRAEKTSTTKRNRRVAEFDWEQFRHACALNSPTDIVLTFADYINAENRTAQRFEQLTKETLCFIEELERVAHAPVSLISTRFGARAIIDRRDWW